MQPIAGRAVGLGSLPRPTGSRRVARDGYDGASTGYHEDPGWPRAREVVRLLLPLGHLTLTRSDGGGRSPVAHLRLIVLSFVVSLVLLVLVTALALPAEVTGTDDPLPRVLLAVGAAAAIVGGSYARRRQLACGPPAQLAAQYRTSFLIGAAAAQSAGLFGFVAAFTVGSLWPYPVGVVLSAVGFALVAPTQARIATVDRDLQARGCPHALSAGLYAPAGAD